MPKILINNISTGEIVEREMTDEEIEQKKKDKIDFAAVNKKADDKNDRRKEIFEKLGLSVDEIELILQ